MTFPTTLTLGHGTGNDFVLLFDPHGTCDPNPAQVSALCDRRMGLGGDGLIRCVPAVHMLDQLPGAEPDLWTMDYRNADGSLAEMCGNGVRVCVAYLLHCGAIAESDLADGGLALATRGGVKKVWRDSATGDVTVSMGTAGFSSVEFGEFTTALQLTGHDSDAAGRSAVHVSDCQQRGNRSGYFVDMGNPHLVALASGQDGEPLAAADLDLSLPPMVNGQPHTGVNVEFVDLPAAREVLAAKPAAEEVDIAMRVYERGVGETLSCGTGAVAAGVVASCYTGRNGMWRVHVPGGHVVVKVTQFGEQTSLGGAAKLLADVTLTPDWVAELQSLGNL